MADFIMMCGLPASGKSTIARWLAAQYNATIHSSDDLREEMFGDINNQDNNNELFQELHRRIKSDLENGQSTIYDACNINYKRRMSFLQEIKKYNVNTICYIIVKEYETCLADNKKRDRTVPSRVIQNMYMTFWIPQKYEGWNEIIPIYTGNAISGYTNEMLKSFENFNQQNEHHSLTLGQHLTKTAWLVYQQSKNEALVIAAQFHDCGKPLTQTFENKKGQTDGNAHYYNHHNVGAYEYLVMALANRAKQSQHNTILDICTYILWHMKPYEIAKNGGKEKFIQLVGQEFYDELMILHKADKLAH